MNQKGQKRRIEHRDLFKRLSDFTHLNKKHRHSLQKTVTNTVEIRCYTHIATPARSQRVQRQYTKKQKLKVSLIHFPLYCLLHYPSLSISSADPSLSISMSPCTLVTPACDWLMAVVLLLNAWRVIGVHMLF